MSTINLTLLRPEMGGRCGKTMRLSADGSFKSVADYAVGARFFMRPASYEFPGELACFAASSAASGDEFILRGAPAPHVRPGIPVQRRMRDADPRRNGVIDVDIDWLAVDCDSVPVPAPLGLPGRVGDAGGYIRDHVLPECFHDAVCVVTATAKTGIVGEDLARLRLWFLLDRPIGNESLRQYFRGFVASTGIPIDPSLYSAVQPHYIARPRWIGCDDPVRPEHYAVVLAGGRERVAIDVEEYAAVAEAVDESVKLVVSACGGDWRRLARETIGGAESYRVPIQRSIGLAVRNGATLAEVQEEVARILERQGEGGRYSADWIAQAYRQFRRGTIASQARAAAAVEAVMVRLTGGKK